MPLSYLDLGVLAIMLLSGLLAMVRGFVREVLSIAAWAAAAAAAYFFYKALVPYVREYIANETVAMVVAIAIIFLVTLIVVSLITVRISDAVLDSRIGFLDRTLGFFYGVVRGVVPVVAAFMIFNVLFQDTDKRPDWVKNARSLPMLEAANDWVISLFPKQMVDDFLAKVKKPKTDAPQPTEPQPVPQAPSSPAPVTQPPKQ